MSQITKIVEAAAEDEVPLAILLKRIKVVASRISAPEVGSWADLELTGYYDVAELPKYRASKLLPVYGNWSGFAGRSISNALVSSNRLPEAFRKAHFHQALRQPVSELEKLAKGDTDPGLDWDPSSVAAYEQFLETGVGGSGFEMMNLMSARTVYPRTYLMGTLDAIRNAVLDLALGLESVGGNVGEPNGPTVADESLSNAVSNFTINIYGDGANVAAGSDINQKNSVIKNDPESLLAASRELGISDAELETLRQAVTAEPGQAGPQTKNFIDRLKNGAVTMTTGVASGMIATQFMTLLSAYYGG